MNSLNRKLLRDFIHYRSQVIAITLVVACGIASFIAMRSNYNSLKKSQEIYYSSYRFADIFAPVKRAPESIRPNILAIPGVSSVNTRIVMEVLLNVPDMPEPATGRFVSIPDQRQAILNDVYIRHGRYPGIANTLEVLASEAFTNANRLKTGDRIYAILNGRLKEVQIVGIAISPEYIYEIRGAEMLPDSKHFGVFWVNRKSMEAAFDMNDAFNDISLTLAPGAHQQQVVVDLDRALERYGGLGAYGREYQISHNFIKGEIDETSITSTYLPAIFLAISAFLISVVLSRLIHTQRNQIGLLKAFGFSKSELAFHYLKFSFLCVLGGAVSGSLVGLWAGSALATVYVRFFHFPVYYYSAGFGVLLSAFGITLFSAAIGSAGAVRRAVALPPAEAMRPDQPANFRSGWMEQFGLQALLSVSSRMIVRNLARRPLKAALSIVGIACAVAVMILGLFAFDALDYIMHVQFRVIHRHDIAVFFQNPMRSNTVHDLAHYPGVIKVEPYRSVAVRLRSEHRSKRVGITGIHANSELRRMVDQQLKKVDLPQSGLVLTSALAKSLRVQTGDRITLEVLEGSKPVREDVVAGIVDEPVGLSVYMEMDALNRLLQEGSALSGAYLSVDSNRIPQLYSALKKTPSMSGVSIRENMLKSFQDTIAESFTISLNLLIGFACVIAFSIVYNGSRIALSERGHELASLRVLGFHQSEISWMLLGEQALLLLLATPVGFVLGYGICSLIEERMATDLYRLPLIITGRTYLFAFLVAFASFLVSAILVIRRIRELDLVEVLKSRE